MDTSQLIGTVMIFGLIIMLFVYERQMKRLKNDPLALWKTDGIKSLQTKSAEFELWNDEAHAVKFENYLETRWYWYDQQLKFSDYIIEVRVVDNSDASLVTFEREGRLITKASFKKEWTLTTFRLNFHFHWQNDEFFMPGKGDILKNREMIGRIGSYGIEQIPVLCIRRNLPLELKAIIASLVMIKPIGQRPYR